MSLEITVLVTMHTFCLSLNSKSTILARKFI